MTTNYVTYAASVQAASKAATIARDFAVTVAQGTIAADQVR
jgi:hypothetical protein